MPVVPVLQPNLFFSTRLTTQPNFLRMVEADHVHGEPKWRVLSQLLLNRVLKPVKTMKKIFKIKIFSDLPTQIGHFVRANVSLVKNCLLMKTFFLST